MEKKTYILPLVEYGDRGWRGERDKHTSRDSRVAKGGGL